MNCSNSQDYLLFSNLSSFFVWFTVVDVECAITGEGCTCKYWTERVLKFTNFIFAKLGFSLYSISHKFSFFFKFSFWNISTFQYRNLKTLVHIPHNTDYLKKSVIWKNGTFCFINQLSNDFEQINLVTCKHLVHCGYFEYNTFSDNQILTQIWLERDTASQTFWSSQILLSSSLICWF